MDIDVKSLPAGKLLSEVKPGTCFMRGSDVYIKTDEVDPDGDIQVVNLKDGSLHRYPSNNEVYIIKARLIDISSQITGTPIFGSNTYNAEYYLLGGKDAGKPHISIDPVDTSKQDKSVHIISQPHICDYE